MDSSDESKRDERQTKPPQVDETVLIGKEIETASDESLPTATVPETFGRYRILNNLGQGGMGSVYLAHDTQLDRNVALKIPNFTADTEPKRIERFLREARLAATLRHPNICPVYDVGEIDGIHFITMAYIRGFALSEYVDPNNPQKDRRVAGVVRKVALALHEAHANGLVHRDVKPANVMIDHLNEPIVMDFGLARQIDENETARLTQDGTLIGSPAYMAPEQVDGSQRKLGPACDIYSLGVVLFELLTGRLPYEGSIVAIVGQILSGEPADPRQLRPEVDPRLAAICQKAMARKIEDRFASMRDFADALLVYLKGDRAESPGPPDRPSSTDAGRQTPQGKTLDPRQSSAPATPRPIRVACGCGQRFAAKPSLAGQAVKCPVCGGTIKIPIPSDAGFIIVRCRCGQRFAAKSRLAGKTVKCTACGGRLQIPGPS